MKFRGNRNEGYEIPQATCSRQKPLWVSGGAGLVTVFAVFTNETARFILSCS